MAGDWIKVDKTLLARPPKPKLMAIAKSLSIPPDEALVLVLRFWSWVDGVCADGRLPGITSDTLDASLNSSGLASALISVGWLRSTAKGLTIPRFERHMGASAKKRAQSALRSGKYRSSRSSHAPSASPSSLSLPPKEGNAKDSEVRPPGRPRSDLPCDNPEKFPAARGVVDHFQKLHPHHSRGKGIEVVIGRLNDGETEARLKAAAEGYASSCRSKGIETPRRLSSAVFFSPGGEWENHAGGAKPAEGTVDAAYLQRQLQRRKEYEAEEAKAREAALRRAGKETVS